MASWKEITVTPNILTRWKNTHGEACACEKCGKKIQPYKKAFRQESRCVVRRYLDIECYNKLYV